jgi:uridine kinase
MKIRILNIEWNLILCSDSYYKKKHGSDSRAMLYENTKTIYFCKSELDLNLIRHELLHAFVSSSSIRSSKLNASQMEELCAEIVAHHLTDILILSEYILTNLTSRR